MPKKRSPAHRHRAIRLTGSPAHRAQAREAMRSLNEVRHLRPVCGARAKSTGEGCRQIAMGNGRCYLHGGRVPKGDGWHKPRWPDRDTPRAIEKLDAKVRALAKAQRKRERRLAAMTPDELTRHEQWQKTHQPGSAAARARRRAERQQNADARASINALRRPQKVTEELAALDALIATLKAEIAAAGASVAAGDAADDDHQLQQWQGAFA